MPEGYLTKLLLTAGKITKWEYNLQAADDRRRQSYKRKESREAKKRTETICLARLESFKCNCTLNSLMCNGSMEIVEIGVDVLEFRWFGDNRRFRLRTS